MADNHSVAHSSLPSYDSRIIEQFAANLYRKASSFVLGSILVGVALGAAFGSVPLTSLGDSWPIPSLFGFATLMLGGLLGGIIGYVIGDTRSFGYRLQAQTALCQLQMERNTAALATAVTARAQAVAEQPPASVASGSEPQAAPTLPPVSSPVSATRVA